MIALSSGSKCMQWGFAVIEASPMSMQLTARSELRAHGARRRRLRRSCRWTPCPTPACPSAADCRGSSARQHLIFGQSRVSLQTLPRSSVLQSRQLPRGIGSVLTRIGEERRSLAQLIRDEARDHGVHLQTQCLEQLTPAQAYVQRPLLSLISDVRVERPSVQTD